MSGDHSNYSIIKISQNTEKSPRGLKRLAVTQTLVEDHQLMLKLLWDFDIHMDHLISARRPDLIIINKKKRTCKIINFTVLADHIIQLKK